jgi:hypothetical protein
VIKQKAVSEKTKSKQQKTKTKTTMKTKVTTPARRSRLSAATAQATLLEVMTGTHDAACYYCG